MKTLFLMLSFLLLTFTTNAKPVADQHGDPLLPSKQYFVTPYYSGPSGGSALPGAAGNSTYSTDVMRFFSEIDYGMPVIFLPLEKSRFISTDTKLRTEFAEKPPGVSSGNWIAVKDMGEEWSVGIGGTQDHKGYETQTGFFKIITLDAGYGLFFFPNLFNTSSTYLGEEQIWCEVFTKGHSDQFRFVKSSTESS